MSNSWGAYVLFDPFDIEKFFSSEDSLGQLPNVWEELQEESVADLERVKEFLPMLPAREADFLELYFFKKVRQTSIAELFNVSQPTVCYRLQRGAARIKYLMDLPEYDIEEMREELGSVLSDPTDVTIMVRMVETTCQSDVARELGVTQGFVRHRFFRTIGRLEKLNGMETYVEVFTKVSQNLNVLKNTSRASWPDEMIYSLG